MVMAGSDILSLAAQCAPAVAPATMLAVVRAESASDPWVIGVNGPRGGRLSLSAREAAVARAKGLVATGANVDIGLAQINSRNLGWLGLTIEGAFDPCRNLAAAARVLQAGYVLGQPSRVGQQQALRVAFSYYNTGRPDRGFANGYVSKVTAGAGAAPRTAAITDVPDAPPAWDVFGSAPARSVTLVFDTQTSGAAR